MNTLANARARSDILARLRDAAPVSDKAAPDVLAYYARNVSATADLAPQFSERARGWRAEVIDCHEGNWTAVLADVIAAKGIQHLLAGRGTPLVAGLDTLAPPLELHWYDEPLANFKPVLFDRIDAGITTTRGGIAETGSLIVWPATNEPRTLSLVPPIHIAVLRVEDMYPTLHAAMQAQDWAAQLPTNALLVTGPSKTADIQRLLVYGAHGPRRLIILLLHPEPAA